MNFYIEQDFDVKKTPTLFETKTKAISTLPWHFNEFNLWNRILSLNANYLNL